MANDTANGGKTALVIGASRGLGLGLAREFLKRGWSVIATTRGRNDEEIEALAKSSGGKLCIETLDVKDEASAAGLAERLSGTPLDLLFVSAGISNDPSTTIGDVPADVFLDVMHTNALAPLKIIETLGGTVAEDGAIVAMTSILGSVGENTSGGYEAYRASKAALNTLLRSYGHRHKERSVVAMHPGWVRTDMGGSNATLGVEESVTGMADVVESRLGKPGCVYLDYAGKTITW